MMNMRRFLAICLSLCMILSLVPMSVFAVENEETVVTDLAIEQLDGNDYSLELNDDSAAQQLESAEVYSDDDQVKVIIVMEEDSVMAQDADAVVNEETLEQVEALEEVQAEVVSAIEETVLEGESLDVGYNYTWLLNAVSAEVPYGMISEIKAVDGVKDVLLQRVYNVCETTAEPLTNNDGTMIGREDTWTNGYSGEGLVIAVIDTGIDTDHQNFQALASDVEVALTADDIADTLATAPLNATARFPGLGVEDVYVNSKVVYGFNYCDNNTNFTHDADTMGDHGTHVSGIAAANKVEGSDVVGVAPDAQLMAMKVFGYAGGAYDADILAALEDAKMLGADVINLSLGSPAGFTSSEYGEVNMDPYFDLIAESDVVLTISAGNNFNSGYGNTWGTNQNLTSHPDNGVMGAPGLYHNVMSVASVENVAYPALYIDVDGYKMGYADTATDFPRYALTTLTGEYGVVAVPNTGAPEDYEGLDVTGKVALVQRGTLSFYEKVDNAANAGAVACIVYNNTTGEIYMDLTDSESLIPAVSITMANGAYLLTALEENADLTISFPEELANMESAAAYTMSSFSSWGPAPDLTLEPDITAPGGNIYSTTNGGTYGVMSGTSMSAPNMAGISALVMEYVRENFDDETTDYREMVRDLLMSTSEPLVYPENGVTYSPRSQGSGLANAFNAVNTQAYLTVDGSDTAKVELGDDSDRTGSYDYTFHVHNFGDDVLFFDMNTTAQTEGVTSYGEGGDGLDFMSGTPVALSAATTTESDAAILTHDVDDNGACGSHDAYWIYQAVQGTPMDENWTDLSFRYDTTNDEAVTTDDVQAYLEALVGNDSDADLEDMTLALAAGETAEVSVNVTLSDDDKAYFAKYFVNGGYVEGYTYLTAQNSGAVSLSLPYLGFYGDWAEPTVLDDEVYYYDYLNEGLVGNQYYHAIWTEFGTLADGSMDSTVPGANLYVEEVFDPAHISLSPDGNGYFDSVMNAYISTMRNASEMTVSYTDANTGEVYDSRTYHNISKSYFNQSAGALMPTIYSWYESAPYDVAGLPNNTELILEFALKGVDADDEVESISYPITIDLEAPELLAASIITDEEAGTKTLELTFKDNVSVAVLGMINGNSTVEYLREPVEDVEDDENGYQNYTVSYDVTNVPVGKVIIVLGDYALNESYYALNLMGEGNSYDDLVGFQYDYATGINSWVSFGEGVDMNETAIFASDINFVAAEYVNGHVLAQTEDGKLYGFAYADLLTNSLDLEETYITQLDFVYQDFAYSYAEGKLYGLLVYEDGGYPTTEINSINLKGEYYDPNMWMTIEPYQEDWVLGRGGLYGLGMAIDDAGTIYVLGTKYTRSWDENDEPVVTASETASLWSVGLEYDQWSDSYMLGWSLSEIGDVGMSMDYLQSMTWDHNAEKLYWARFDAAGMFSMESELVEINPETAEATVVGTLTGETCALFAPLTDESAAKEEHSNVPSMDTNEVGTPILRDATVTMNIGGMKTLGYDFDPWYTAHKELTWSSDNTDVVTVDETGTITAVGAGTAVVTAANKADETKLDTVTVQVTALDLKLEGVVSTLGGTVGSTYNSRLYTFEMVGGAATMTEGNSITAPEEHNFGLSLATSAMGRGSLWACEYGNTGMIYEIDSETGVVVDSLMPVDGDMMFGLAYSETLDSFTGIMNYHLYVDQPLTHWAEEQIMNSYDETEHAFMWRRLNMLPYLEEANGGFVTGETGQGASSEIVFTGVTVIEGGEEQYLYMDFMGGYGPELYYTPTQTLVLMDNVGRLWYIDEVTGMSVSEVSEWGTTYSNADGSSVISTELHGVEAVEIVDEEGNASYSVFVIRALEETPLTDMFRQGSLPRMTYHFSDIEYAGTSPEGAPMFVMSLYDYWNNGTTNELYLYVPGVGTGEFEWDENWNRVEIKTPSRLFDLGDSGEYNVIATIHSAEVTGGLGSESTEEETTVTALGVGAFTK